VELELFVKIISMNFLKNLAPLMNHLSCNLKDIIQ